MAINQKTGMEFEGKSDNEGNYLIGPLPVGTYKLRNGDETRCLLGERHGATVSDEPDSTEEG